jgi:hypothetical protein
MTKSIDKATVNSVMVKLKVGDNTPSFIDPKDLIVNGITLDKHFKNIDETFKEQATTNREQAELNLEQTKLIANMRKDINDLKNDLQAFKELFKDTIESWTKL